MQSLAVWQGFDELPFSPPSPVVPPLPCDAEPVPLPWPPDENAPPSPKGTPALLLPPQAAKKSAVTQVDAAVAIIDERSKLFMVGEANTTN